MSDEPDPIFPTSSQQMPMHTLRMGRRWYLLLLEQYKELVAAVRFLSTVPVPGSVQLFQVDNVSPRLIMGSAYFPLVGLLLALLLSIVPLIFGPYVPPLVLAALLVIVMVFLTGGLHLDGLMDTCDGLFSGTERERKLEIMRDSRVGSFGVLGGVCILLLKFAVFASLDIQVLPWVLLTVLPVSRWGMVLAVRQFPSARPTGLGMAFRQTVSLPRLFVAALCSLAVALLVAHVAGLILWIAGTLVAVLIGAWATHHLGGLTGDIYGAIAEVSEVVLLVLFIIIVKVKLYY